MEESIVGYSVRLEAWFRRDGRDWLAWCPAIDVVAQDRTKKSSQESLREAVEAWFESCIDRGVLAEALMEAGFANVPRGETVGDVNVVNVIKKPTRQRAPQRSARPKELSFSLGHKKGADFIEGMIPAYVAARQLGDTARAAS